MSEGKATRTEQERGVIEGELEIEEGGGERNGGRELKGTMSVGRHVRSVGERGGEGRARGRWAPKQSAGCPSPFLPFFCFIFVSVGISFASSHFPSLLKPYFFKGKSCILYIRSSFLIGSLKDW